MICQKLTPIRLIDAFPNAFTTGGIFSNMVDPPWGTSYNGYELDLQFFTAYGERIISPIVKHYLVNDVIPDEKVKELSKIILSRFLVSWSHKNEMLKLSYDPIQNYDMTETSNDTGKDTHTETSNDTQNRTQTTDITSDVDGTVVESTTGKDDTTSSSTRDLKREIYAFNDGTPSPDSNENETISGTESLTTSADRDVTSGTKTTGTNKVVDSGTNETTHNLSIDRSDTHTLNRSGNIGVTTSQQMIQAEIDLWNWNFVTDIFSDVRDMISLQIY